MARDEPLRFETLAIHAGQAPDPSTGAIMIAIGVLEAGSLPRTLSNTHLARRV